MPSALTIISTEHLPEENTLLIHYSISQAGTWDLAQMLSAYRNVIDTGWTVMFPNTQHPRHTDFPVIVGSNGITGTFAWNYGGIRGIDPANFNDERSYLLQLTVYNADEGTVTNQTQTTTVGGETNVSTGGQVTPASLPTKPTPPRRVPPRTKTPPIRPGPLPPAPGTTVKDTYVYIPPRTTPVPPEPIGDPGGEIPSGPVLSAPAPIFPGVFLPPPFVPDYVPSAYSKPRTIPSVPNEPGQVDPGSTKEPSTYDQPIVIDNPNYSPPRRPNNVDPDPPKGPSTYEVPTVIINNDYRGPRVNVNVNVDPRTAQGFIEYDVPSIIVNDNYRGPGGGGGGTSLPGIRTRPKIAATDVSPIISTTSTPITVTRPNEDPPGGGVGTSNPYQSRVVRSNATASDAGVVRGTITNSYPIDLTEVTTTAGIAGYLSKFNYSEKVQAGTTQDTSITHIDTGSVIPGSILLIEVPVDDVAKGTPIFVSSAFTVPTGTEIICRLELWAKDSQNRTILIHSKDIGLVKFGSPGTLAYTIESYSFTPGPVTLIVLVKDLKSRVIGVSSRKLIIRPTLNQYRTDAENRIRETANVTTFEGMPASIVDLVNISKPPISFYIKNSKAVRFLVNKVSKTEDKFGVVVVSSSKNVLENYRIDVFSNPVEGEFIPVPNIKGQYNNIIYSESKTLLASSNKRIKLDGNELNPQSHTVGITPFSTTENSLLICLAPDVKSNFEEDRQVDIYLNNSYALKQFTITISKQSPTVYTISGYSPYVMETLGLIVHGKNPDNISENYVIMYANTGVDGSFVWPNVSIQAGDYYSIIAPRYNSYNPLIGKVYTAKL